MRVERRSLWYAETNTYIVGNGPDEPCLIIDAPPDPAGLADLVAAHRGLPVGLLVTHGHVDHAGGAGSAARRWDLTAYVHPLDDFLTLDPETQLRMLFGMMPPGDYAPPSRYESLTDGQIIDVAGVRLEVVHTPGHTPGHCCFYHAGEGTLFSGDQLFAGSIGRTDLPGGSYPQLLESMRDKILVLDDEIAVLPGHGPPTTLGHERRFNPFLQGL